MHDLGTVLVPALCSLALYLSLLSVCLEVSIIYSTLSTMMFSFAVEPEATEPRDCGLYLQNHEPKYIFLSLSFFSQIFCHSDDNLTHCTLVCSRFMKSRQWCSSIIGLRGLRLRINLCGFTPLGLWQSVRAAARNRYI